MQCYSKYYMNTIATHTLTTLYPVVPRASLVCIHRDLHGLRLCTSGGDCRSPGPTAYSQQYMLHYVK